MIRHLRSIVNMFSKKWLIFLPLPGQALDAGDLPRIAVQVVGRLQVKGQAAQGWVVHHAGERLEPDRSEAELLVPILAAAQGVLAVVEVHGPQARQAHDAIELLQHAVQVAADVVPRVMDMARQTPSFSGRRTRSRMARSSAKLPPTSDPLPAMVSRSTVVDCSGRRIAFRCPAMRSTPASAPWRTWLPGWKL
mgnify:CR=1 FL=1